MAGINLKLKELREKTGFNQSQVADFLGVTQSFLSKAESGERNFTVDQVEKLATLYGYDSAELKKNESLMPINLAFRANDVTQEDLSVIADINQIYVNLKFMNRLLGRKK